jgi:anaerobic magnesium-protoporphyrin IX monomethyl ester cyclase
MAKVTLIRPPSVFAKFAFTLNAIPPISLAYIAGSLAHAGHIVQIIDSVGEALDQVYDSSVKPLLMNGLRMEQIIARIPADTEVVGLSCLFTHEWPTIQELAKNIHLHVPNAKIILGGEHVTAVPEYSLESCPELDVGILGEGEETAVELIKAFETGKDLGEIAGIAYRKEGKVVETPRRGRIRNIDAIPLPRWDLIPLEAYLSAGKSFGVDIGRTIPMLATRGCPFICTFCSNANMWTQRYETRKPALVVEEIESYIRDYKIENVDFYDLTAIIHRDWIIEFCKLLIQKKLNLKWQLPSGTRSEALDEEVCGYLYEAGCRNISYAPESGSPRVLKAIKKMVIPERMLKSMRAATSKGLNLKANIIFGFPDETLMDVFRSIKFIWQMALAGVADVSIWAYSPYPGSELYDLLKGRGKVRDFDTQYFVNLLAYSDFTSLTSYDDYLSPRMIRTMRVFGMASFYLVSYLSSPLRLFKSLRNLITGSYQSRMEMSVGTMIKRIFAYKQTQTSETSGPINKQRAA